MDSHSHTDLDFYLGAAYSGLTTIIFIYSWIPNGINNFFFPLKQFLFCFYSYKEKKKKEIKNKLDSVNCKNIL